MKILYITYGQTPDYLSDSILHGFKELGHEIHEISDCWYLYKKNKSTNWKIKIPNEGKSYGFGYSLHGTLDDNLNSFGKYNLEELFEEKYYDFVFFANFFN